MGIARLILGTIVAGLVLSSCGLREPKVAVPIEFPGSVAGGSEFEKWILDLIKETCHCPAQLENDLLMVPESKKERVVRVLRIWSGEDITGVSFHGGHRDQELLLPPDRILAPFRHDPERKGVIDQASIMGDSSIGITEVDPLYESSGWRIMVRFDERTSVRMEEYTKSHVGEQIAILLNGEILSMPVIVEPFSSGASITGDFTEEEARGIAIGIRNPPPVKFRIREESNS